MNIAPALVNLSTNLLASSIDISKCSGAILFEISTASSKSFTIIIFEQLVNDFSNISFLDENFKNSLIHSTVFKATSFLIEVEMNYLL